MTFLGLSGVSIFSHSYYDDDSRAEERMFGGADWQAAELWRFSSHHLAKEVRQHRHHMPQEKPAGSFLKSKKKPT